MPSRIVTHCQDQAGLPAEIPSNDLEPPPSLTVAARSRTGNDFVPLAETSDLRQPGSPNCLMLVDEEGQQQQPHTHDHVLQRSI